MPGLPQRGQLSQMAHAAVEPLLRALDTAESRPEASRLLSQVPPAVALKPLLHLLARPAFRQAAKEVLLGLEGRAIEYALALLLGEAAGGGQAFAVAQRCLDYLWPETRDGILRLAEAGEKAAAPARRYLAFKEPTAQQGSVRSLYPHRELMAAHLSAASGLPGLMKKLAQGRPWLADRRGDELLQQYHGDLVIACLSTPDDAEGKARGVLEELLEYEDTLTHAVHALALPECRAGAIRLLNRVWDKQASKILALWPTYPSSERALFNGLLKEYVRGKGAGGLDQVADRLEISRVADQAARCLAEMGAEAIPALARVARRAGYSKGVMIAVEAMLAEVISATLSDPGLRNDGLLCLRTAGAGTGRAKDEHVEPVNDILRLKDFSAHDWPTCVRRNSAMPDGFPDSLSLRHAIYLCCAWEVTPFHERLRLIHQVQERLARLLNLCLQVYRRELADIDLTASHMVVELYGRWYINPPAAPAIVAHRLTSELREQLYYIRRFLTYVCQVRMFGEVKDFARETLRLLPS
jgi:hypothetical protein